MIMVLQMFDDLGVRLVLFDQVHNMMAGSFREHRRVLAHLRYLSNDLRAAIVCLGIASARNAIASDEQLARRFGIGELPAWQADDEFKALIGTVLRRLPLKEASMLDGVALNAIARNTRGNTARIFEMMGDLAASAIASGEERITRAAVEAWRPSLYDRTLAA